MIMKVSIWRLSVLPGLAFTLLAGCTTTGSSGQIEATIHDTHRRVVKLDKSIDASVGRLNETSATLATRVEQGDQQTRRLHTIAEENQKRLEDLQRELAALKTVAYRRWGLSVSSGPDYGGPITPLSSPQVDVVVVTPGETDNTATTPGITPVPPASTPVGTYDIGDPVLYYDQAKKSFLNGDLEAALQKFQDFLRRFPTAADAPGAKYWVAKCHANLGRDQEAIRGYQALRVDHPKDTKVPFSLHSEAMVCARLGQTQRAIALLQEILDQYPMSVPADSAKSDLKKLQGR
jgi:tol-pal system protein YbgF